MEPRGSIADSLADTGGCDADLEESLRESEKRVATIETDSQEALAAARMLLEAAGGTVGQLEPHLMDEMSALVQVQLDELAQAQGSIQQKFGEASRAAGAKGCALALARLVTKLRQLESSLASELSRMTGRPAPKRPTQSSWMPGAGQAAGPPKGTVPAVLPARPKQQWQWQAAAGPAKGQKGQRQWPAPPARFEGPIPRLEDPVPLVAVFDLDETCWSHFGLDHKADKFQPPFRWCEQGRCVVDSADKPVMIFPELPAVLLALSQAGVQLAVASHDTQAAWCGEVMDSFMLNDHLRWGDLVPEHLRIISCSGKHWPGKANHLSEIRERCGCEYSDMLFFDDGRGNCQTAMKLGAAAVRCQGGITIGKLWEGLQSWAAAKDWQEKGQRGQKRAWHEAW